METIEPLALAARGRVLEGRLPLSSLPRLMPLLAFTEAEDEDAANRYVAEYVLEFGVDEGGVPRITGTVNAILPLKCQRCMEAMELPIATHTQLGIVSSRAAAQQLPERYDPLVLTDDEITVANIVEDELILALPLVAMHDSKECPQGNAFLTQNEKGQEDASISQRENPFAVLAKLKTSQSEKND